MSSKAGILARALYLVRRLDAEDRATAGVQADCARIRLGLAGGLRARASHGRGSLTGTSTHGRAAGPRGPVTRVRGSVTRDPRRWERSEAVAINEAGQVVGNSEDHAFLWDPVTGMRTSDPGSRGHQ